MNETTYTCPRCASPRLVKNGRNQYGGQQFRCKACGKSGVLQAKNSYSESEKERVLAAYRERPSMRGIARVFGISRNTLVAWLKKSLKPATSQPSMLLAEVDNQIHSPLSLANSPQPSMLSGEAGSMLE